MAGSGNLQRNAGVPAARRRGLGIIAYMLGCLLAALAGVAAVAMLSTGGQFMVALLAFVVLLLGAVGLLLTAEGFFVPDAREVCARDPRPPVLFLRPFDEDRELTYDVISSGETVTSLTARAEDFLMSLNAIGPLISIGEPTARSRIGIHPLGVFRDYVDQEEWQHCVTRLLDDAGMVVLAIGDSPGIEWEIEQVKQRIGPESLLLYLPPRPAGAFTRKGRENKERAVYEHFKSLVESHFAVMLPPFSEALYVIGFRASGEPVVALGARRGGWVFTEHGRIQAAIRGQLEAVLAKLGSDTGPGAYALPGRAAMWGRVSLSVLMFLAAAGITVSAGSGGVALQPALSLLTLGLPQLALCAGWVLLARYFARPWVWSIPALLIVLMLLDLRVHAMLLFGDPSSHPGDLLQWISALQLLLNSAYAVSVLILGLVLPAHGRGKTTAAEP